MIYKFGAQKAGDPQYPDGVIAQGRDGNLYSACAFGGTFNDGAVFRITPQGSLSVLYDFTSYNGSSGLTLGTGGDFFGTAIYGGPLTHGTIFKITPAGKLTVLYEFTGQDDDKFPSAPPIEAADGNFYGTTNGAEGDISAGTVYSMRPSGKERVVFRFAGFKGGTDPVDPLVQGNDGNFYGTAAGGGAYGGCGWGCGTVFTVTAKGVETVLHNFDHKSDDGNSPDAPLIQANDGNFYGTASYGGIDEVGTVFRITASGKFTLLHTFQGGVDDGAGPWRGLVQATDGNLYGVTAAGGVSSYGTIYRITPAGLYSVVYNFEAPAVSPSATLIQHTNGKLYGTTSGIDASGFRINYGTFLSVDLGLEPFVSLQPTSGKAGQLVGILGQGFKGASSVEFDGMPATFNVESDTFLTATVPAGASTGFVTVNTHGNLKSNKEFRVLR